MNEVYYKLITLGYTAMMVSVCARGEYLNAAYTYIQYNVPHSQQT